MLVLHPVFLALSLLGALGYCAVLRGWRSLGRTLGWLVPFLVLMAVLNALFNHAGVTMLFYLPNGNPVTREALCYGAAAAAMFAAVILWFQCCNVVMTAEKYLYVFGSVLPGVSLLLSMALRFVPKFSAHIRAVRAAQVFLARAGLTCGVHIRLHKRIPVCAGLGGGSSDAAAVLRARERLTGAGFALDVSHMGFAGGLLADAGLDGSQREQAIRLIRQKNAHELARQLSQWQGAPFYAVRIAQLPVLCGDFTHTLRRAADIAVGADMNQAVGELSSLYAALDALDLCGHVRLDFSILNDLDYYNGLVFQGYVEGAPRGARSGGRYDKLMRKFGKAGDGLGFALYLDQLQRVLARPAGDDVDVRVRYGAQDEELLGIVNEEAGRFFAGDCTAEQCAAVIQDRVSIYINERR